MISQLTCVRREVPAKSCCAAEICDDKNKIQMDKIKPLKENIIALSCFFMEKAFYAKVAVILEMTYSLTLNLKFKQV